MYPAGQARGRRVHLAHSHRARCLSACKSCLRHVWLINPHWTDLRRRTSGLSAAHLDRQNMARSGGISAMDYKSLTSLVLRLTGVIIIVSSVASTPQIFIGLLYRRGVEATDNMEIWLLSVVASAFPFLVGLVLIYFPAT